MEIKEILALSQREQDETVRLRRLLHQRPELAYQEFETAEIIRGALKRWGIPFRAVGTGTIADIPGGSAPALALRADIDALPIEEKTGLEFASLNPGRMHACGHDCHTAMLLGAAHLLWTRRGELPGPVRLIFQPAEESGAGAVPMIKAGALEGIRSIYCLHVGSGYPIAVFATRPGNIHAASDGYQIRIHGTSCHGARPHKGVDAIHIAAHTVLALEGIIAREVNAQDQAVMTIGKIEGGTAKNIVCGEVVMDGTLRTTNEEVRAKIRERMTQIVEGTAAMERGTAELEFRQGYCSCWNDETETDFAVAAAHGLFGDDCVRILEKPSMGAEDFGFYQQKIPGVKLYIGTGYEEGIHTPYFRFDEAGLAAGVALQAAIAFTRYANA